jgi:hypothetical protein
MSNASAKKISDFSDAEEVHPEEPRPLMREMPPALEYPAGEFGPLMQGAVAGIYAMTQAPMAICAQSVLAVAALGGQSLHDIELPSGQVVPLSLYLVSVAESGDRKSSADRIATDAVTEREKELKGSYEVDHFKFKNTYEAYKREREHIVGNKKLNMEQRKQALSDLGPEPNPPLTPQLSSTEPTFEGLVKLLAVGMPSVGIFSAEGGQFVSGHAMNQDNRIKTSAGLSQIWDGAPIKRVRAGDGSITLMGRRVSLHLMMQPGVASQMLGDAALADQGLLSRILVAAPETLAGTRAWSDPSLSDRMYVDRFKDRALLILRQTLPLMEGTQNELKPEVLRLSRDAKKLCIAFYNEIEGKVGDGGRLRSVRGFANKVLEHAVRIAAVLAVFEGAVADGAIGADYVARGIALARYYLSEALRLFEAQSINSEIMKAQVVLSWAQNDWVHGPLISVPDIYQRGPNSIRVTTHAEMVVRILVEHGWLAKAGPGVVDGNQRRQTYRIHGWRGPAS